MWFCFFLFIWQFAFPKFPINVVIQIVSVFCKFCIKWRSKRMNMCAVNDIKLTLEFALLRKLSNSIKKIHEIIKRLNNFESFKIQWLLNHIILNSKPNLISFKNNTMFTIFNSMYITIGNRIIIYYKYCKAKLWVIPNNILNLARFLGHFWKSNCPIFTDVRALKT